jgi:hypothetical protein
MPRTLADQRPPTLAQEPSPEPALETVVVTTMAEPSAERAQGALERAQGVLRGLHAERTRLVTAYDGAAGERMQRLAMALLGDAV